MIRRCEEDGFHEILTIINDGAEAYRGIIPADRWTDPYMSREKLEHEIESGVQFWSFEKDATLLGVMGVQNIQNAFQNVTLIRHAYVRTTQRRLGVGGQLLSHLRDLTSDPILIGTWADSVWAIRFYERHGFQVVSVIEKELLLRRYWSIPERQVETSVVLAYARWQELASSKRHLESNN